MRKILLLSGIGVLSLSSRLLISRAEFAKLSKVEKEKPPQYRKTPQRPLYPGHHKTSQSYEVKKLQQRNRRYA